MKEVTYNVDGMSCVHCAAHVASALESLPGVKAVVTLEPAQAVIQFADKVYDKSELQAVVAEKAGDYTLF